MVVDTHLLALFVLTTAVAMLVPGPDMLFILGCGARSGPRAGLLATCGVATSEVIHVAAAATGLSALFLAVPTAFTVLRLLGAGYLVFLGVQAFRHRGQGFDVHDATPPTSGRQAFVRGLGTNLLNPKMVTFTVAFLPQFVSTSGGHPFVQFAVLGAILVALEFVVDGTVGLLAGRIGGWLRGRRRARVGLDVTVGGVFVGLGARLALDRST